MPFLYHLLVVLVLLLFAHAEWFVSSVNAVHLWACSVCMPWIASHVLDLLCSGSLFFIFGLISAS